MVNKLDFRSQIVSPLVSPILWAIRSLALTAAVVTSVTTTAMMLASCATGSTGFNGFSSGSKRLSTEPEDAGKNARAHPAAYGIIDTYTFGKPQEVRPPNDFIFYYKDCELTDPDYDRAFFSKTAYSCAGVR